jgi:pSer/pThr/pTyr-binding forkhead associated (FHA) protein
VPTRGGVFRTPGWVDGAGPGGPAAPGGVASLGAMDGSPRSPMAAHVASPEELRDRIEAERRGRPFLVLREEAGPQRIVDLDPDMSRLSVGRAPQNDVDLQWDTEVSRLHAELEQIGGEWTVSDDGLSRNGTFVNGARISGRHRLRDGDVVRVGRTQIAFKRPDAEDSMPTQVAAMTGRPPLGELPPLQRKVLVALARPYKHDEFAVPATNQEIADELHLSVDAVKSHLRTLFGRFGIEHLPQNQKRSRLVAEALQAGLVSVRDL